MDCCWWILGNRIRDRNRLNGLKIKKTKKNIIPLVLFLQRVHLTASLLTKKQ